MKGVGKKRVVIIITAIGIVVMSGLFIRSKYLINKDKLSIVTEDLDSLALDLDSIKKADVGDERKARLYLLGASEQEAGKDDAKIYEYYDAALALKLGEVERKNVALAAYSYAERRGDQAKMDYYTDKLGGVEKLKELQRVDEVNYD